MEKKVDYILYIKDRFSKISDATLEAYKTMLKIELTLLEWEEYFNLPFQEKIKYIDKKVKEIYWITKENETNMQK